MMTLLALLAAVLMLAGVIASSAVLFVAGVVLGLAVLAMTIRKELEQ